MYKVESDATISSPVNRSNMELLYFLKELEKDVKARNSSTPQDPSALEQLTFEYENIVNALHKAEYVCDLTPSACYYKTLGSLVRLSIFISTVISCSFIYKDVYVRSQSILRRHHSSDPCSHRSDLHHSSNPRPCANQSLGGPPCSHHFRHRP